MSQTHLHSNKLNMCRICLFEPETDSNVKLVHINTPVTGKGLVKELIVELLGINVEPNDFKPKIICENCYNSLLNYMEMKKKAAESEIVIKYLISKKFGVNIPRATIEYTPSVMITSNGESTQESLFQHSQLSQRTCMYGTSTSGLCIASTSSQLDVNKPGTSIHSSLQHSTSRVSFASTSSQSQLISNSGFVDDSDDDSDDSCVDVTAPNPTVDLISDDDDNDVDSNINNISVQKNEKKNKIPRTSEHVLFTCLKPSCDLIFHTFTNFKIHHRSHFNLESTLLVCWQCCKPFNNATQLRMHQLRYKCRTPGMFKCSKCSEKFDDIENFSIHKFNFHGGKLMASRRNNKTIICAFCQMDINIFDFQSHLTTCQKKNVNKNTSTKKHNGTFNCLTCGKVFLSSTALSNHSKIYNQS